jgi:multisubunit Na+/H+ antiporter MnhG subunit
MTLIGIYNVTVSIAIATSENSFILGEYIFSSILILLTFSVTLHQIIKDQKVSYLMYQKLRMTYKQTLNIFRNLPDGAMIHQIKTD